MAIEYAQHQKDAIAFQQIQPYSILSYATGVGKTVTTIGSQLVNLHQKKLDKCIFVCTKGSLGEVLNDFNKFYNYQPMQLNNRQSIIDFFINSSKHIALTRYEWLKFFEKDLLEEFTKDIKLGIWWDEAQKLKNPSTNNHGYAKLLRPYCKAFHLVTATPIMTVLDDLWGLMSLVDENALGTFQQFSDNFYVKQLEPHPRFAKRIRRRCPVCGCNMEFTNTGWNKCINPYCRAIQTPMGFMPFQEKVKCIWSLIEYKNLDILSQILKPYMFCFYPEQDIHYILHEFDLEYNTELAYYDAAKGFFDKEKEDVPFTTRMIELQYIVDRSNEKKKELFNLANKLKEKGFVLYVSLYDTKGLQSSSTTLEEVQEVLDQIEGLEYRTYSGKEKDDERDENKKWFQEDPKNRCLIITEAGGASLNLQVTNEFVFYNLPAGFGKMSQAFGRVVRLFSTFKTFNIHFILGSHSIDTYKYTGFLMYEEVMKKLLNNKLISTDKPINFNNHMKAELRKDLLWRTSRFA